MTPTPQHIQAIVESISKLKLFEVNLLNSALKTTLKIPEGQMMAAAAVGAHSGAEQEAQDTPVTKTAFNVKLMKFDESRKISLIKEVKKTVPGINLVEAKRMVEEVPRVVGTNMTKADAEALAKVLEEAGGTIKLE